MREQRCQASGPRGSPPARSSARTDGGPRGSALALALALALVNNTKSVHTKREVINPETGEIQSFTLNPRRREFVRETVRRLSVFGARTGHPSM